MAVREFTRWFQGLDPWLRAHLNARITYLAKKGTEAEEPFFKPIIGSKYAMGEIRYDYIPGRSDLRPQQPSVEVHLRVLFVFDTSTDAVMLVGGDKTGNWSDWYTVNVNRAERLFELYKRQHPH